MKTLTKENSVGKFIFAGHTEEGYFYSDMFDNVEEAMARFKEMGEAFGACDNSTSVTGSIEIIKLSEDLQLFSKKDLKDEEELYEEFDSIEIPSRSGFTEDYIIFFPMNDCVIAYSEVEGSFLENL